MKLARLMAAVVSTRKDASLDALELLAVWNRTAKRAPERGDVASLDGGSAALGEVTLYATGISARLTAATKDRSVDAVITRTVNSFVEGRNVRFA